MTRLDSISGSHFSRNKVTTKGENRSKNSMSEWWQQGRQEGVRRAEREKKRRKLK